MGRAREPHTCHNRADCMAATSVGSSSALLLRKIIRMQRSRRMKELGPEAEQQLRCCCTGIPANKNSFAEVTPAISPSRQLRARRSAAGSVLPAAEARPVSARPRASPMAAASSSSSSRSSLPISPSCLCRPCQLAAHSQFSSLPIRPSCVCRPCQPAAAFRWR